MIVQLTPARSRKEKIWRVRSPRLAIVVRTQMVAELTPAQSRKERISRVRSPRLAIAVRKQMAGELTPAQSSEERILRLELKLRRVTTESPKNQTNPLTQNPT